MSRQGPNKVEFDFFFNIANLVIKIWEENIRMGYVYKPCHFLTDFALTNTFTNYKIVKRYKLFKGVFHFSRYINC